MAGGELIIDDKLVRAIHDMEKALQGVAKEADATQRKTMAWLNSLNSGSIDAFTNKLKQLESNYMNLANTLSNAKGFESLSEKALSTAGAITQLITVMGQNTPKKTDGFDSIRQTLDSLLAQLAKARQDIDLYYQAIGTGKKEYIEFGQTGLKEAEARAESLMRKIEALNTAYQQLQQSSFNITNLTKGTMDDERSRIELEGIKVRLLEEERVHKAVMEHNLEELKAINDKIEAGIQGEKALAEAEEERHRKRQEYYNNVGKQWDIDDKAIRDANMAELKAISDKVENAKRAEKEAVESAKREHDAKQKYYEDFGKIIEEEEKRKKQANTDYYNWEMEQLAKEVKAVQDAANKKLQAEQEYAAKRKELQAMYTSLWHRNEADMMSARVAQRTDGQTWNIDANEVIRRTQEELAQRRQYIAERTEMYERMFEEIERKEKKVQDDIRNYEQQKQDESLAKYKQRKEEQARVDKHYHDKRQREYDEMFKAIERNEKRQRAINAKYGDSSKGALNYANRLYSAQGVRSIQNMETALSKLRDAQRRLNVGTEEGRKRYAELGAQIKKIEGELNRVTDAGERMKKSHSGLMNTGQQLARQLALVFSVSQVQGYVNKIVQVRREFELQQKTLGAILRDPDKGNELWNQTIQFAVKSPFRVKELITYTKQLAAYRIETEKLHDTTRMLADVSAGLGVDMNRLILAYGQVRAAEFLRGTELRQFTEAGIPMLEELADHFSMLEGRAVSTADVFERISKRMVMFEDVNAVFEKMTSEGGTFYKMQEKQSETLYGTISNLHDSLDLMMNDIGKSNEGVIKRGLSLVTWLVEHWELLAEAIKGVAAALVIYKVRALAAKASVIEFAAAQGIASGTQALKFTELLAVGWRKVAMAISAAKTALLSNPIPAIILAAAYAVSKLYSAWDDHNEQLADINKEYDELIRKVSNIRINFIFSDDLSDKKKELKSLIDTAEQLNISSKIKMDDVTNDNIDDIFNNLRRLIVERQGLITALTTDFEKATHWKITDDLNEDLKEVGDNITKLTPIIDKYKSSVIDYIDNLGRFTDERKKMFEPIRKDENDLQYYDRLVRAFNEVRKAQKEASTSTAHWIQIMDEAPSVIKDTFDEFTKWRANTNHYFDKDEAKKEFDAFIKEVKPMLKNIPEEDRSIAIKTWIDKEATKREWNTFTTQYLYKWFEEIPDLNIKFAAELPSEKSIPEWKMRVTDAVEKLNKKIKASLPEDSKIRLFTLPSDTDTKESWLNKFKLDIEEAKRVYQDNQAVFGEQEVARTNALKDYSREAEQIANIADKTTKEERDANTILNKRISLIKEIHSAYEKERKLWDAGTSEERVLQSYMLAYEEAFDKSISGYNFKIKDGVVSELLELIPLAEKAGKEAMIALNRAIASVEVEAGDFGKTLADENLVRQIEDMFGTYELSLELKDMNIPSDIAEKLFGLESLDLEGLKAKLEELEPEFVGTDLEEKYRDYLQKVAKMEKEAQQKRLKEYVAFARGAIGERAKVKLEEMQKLEDIEKAFTIKDTDDEDTKATKNKWRNEARKKAQEESANALKKLDWEALKSSDTFNMVFDDLERASEESLKNMIDKLKEFRDQWKDMPFDQMRQVVDLLQKAEEAYSSSSSPFAEGRRLKKAIEIDGRSEEQALLDLSSAESELLTLDNIIAKIQLFQQVKDGLASKETLASEDIELYNKYLSQSVDFYHQITNELSSELPLRYEILRLAQEGKLTEDAVLGLFTRETKTLNEQASGAKKRLTDGQKQAEIYQEQANAIKKMQQMANDLYDSFYDLANNVTELFGGEISETGKIFAESGQEMMNTVLNTISLQKELQAASAQASAFGKALNSAMGIVGWIVMGVQLISKVFSIVTQVHDNKIEKKIQSQIDSVEELEKQYKSLEKTLEHVYSIDTITKFSDDAVNNIDQQIAALDEMIALETEKKNQDEERIKEWYEQREESLEERERLLEEKEKALGGIGGEADYKEASERFVEAWLDAYQETGDGLKGLEEAFDEFFMNMVKKQLVARGVEKMMEPLFKEFDRMFDQDSDGNEKVTKKELDNFQNLWDEALPMMNTTLKSIVEQMGATDEILKGGELGTLQKGIQGITEDQANILASYLNSIRFIIGEHTGYLKTIASNYGDTEVPNPMLGQLQVIANQTSAIHTLLESVTKTGHPQGGYGIKVIM